MTSNDRKKIVEIVRDSRGELSHRFHLLGLAKLALQTQALRNIFDITMHNVVRQDRKERERQRSASDRVFSAQDMFPGGQARFDLAGRVDR